jgi:hypothetical protein
MTLTHGNMLMAFYKSIMQAKSLRKFRQMEDMFAVPHYTQQELFRSWGGFSAKVTHFMSVHGKVNCRKYKNITECIYVNKMNKIGDSYLPCIAMAHSPPPPSSSISD